MESMNQSPIAVVGVAYRAPGTGRKGLHDYLAEAKSAFSPIPKDRFQEEAYSFDDSEKAGVFAAKGAYFLPNDIYAFDAPFFNMNGEEVTSMDPQHRMMLECALEAAENAGIPLETLAGSNTGVFSAAELCEYADRFVDDLPTISKYCTAGISGCMFSNRLSYFLDLRGPSVSLDSACSSSAYAVHLACRSLRTKECNTAFVGASSLIVNHSSFVMLDTMGALSPDGECHSYDSRGNGFGRGEGGASLVLKRLDDAIANGDSIHAVVRNTVTNHSGRTRGITMPSQRAQEDALRRVHAEVGLDPSDTSFVEGHGTGTQVGDPIDAGAVANVVAKDQADPVYIGSLKSNFGHLLSASGMIALVKAILMIRHGTILPNSGFEKMNPKIDATRVRVAQEALPWPAGAQRRICVTNFGFGGSNAAILIEEFQGSPLRAAGRLDGHGTPNGHALLNGHGQSGQANGTPAEVNGNALEANGTATETNGTATEANSTATEANGTATEAKGTATEANGTLPEGSPEPQTSQRLVAFSAKSDKSLSQFLSSFASHLEDIAPSAASDTFMNDLSFTLGQRRTHFAHRLALVADSAESVAQQLSTLSSSSSGKARPQKEPVAAFIFTGQGAQHARMAAGLTRYGVFAAALRAAEDHLREFGAPWSLLEELAKVEGSRVDEPEISQPACTAVQVALVELLRSWGMAPATVAGHSSGEIGAAYAAGLLSLRTSMAVAYFRGRATLELREQSGDLQGAMVALGTDVDTATAILESTAEVGRAGIAAINSPNSVTVSGDAAAVDAVEQIANAQGLFNRRLKVAVAYHSHHMELVAASYQAAIEPYCEADRTPDNLNPKARDGAVFFSSVTGQVESADALTKASYWAKNLVSPVRFSDATQGVVSTPGARNKMANVIIEVGPHQALKGPINQTLQAMGEEYRATYLPTLVRGADAATTMLNLAGRMFVLGSTVDFAGVNGTSADNARVLADLPSYEWNRNARYIHKSPVSVQKMFPGQAYSPLRGWKVPSTGSEHVFRQVFTLDEMPWLRDHSVAGDTLFPFSGFMGLAVDAFRAVAGATPELPSVLIRELHINRGLPVKEEERVDICTKLRPAETGTGTVSSTAWTFEVMTWTAVAGWIRHVHGRIEAGAEEIATTGSPSRVAAEALLSEANPEAEKAEVMYEGMRKSGLCFGPTFKNMTRLWTSPSAAVHETALRQIDPSPALQSGGSQITVDAPSVDALLHSAMVPADENMPVPWPLFVPVYVSRFHISNTIPSAPGQKFTTVTQRLGLEEKTGCLKHRFVVFAETPEGRVACLEADMTAQRVTQPDRDETAAEDLPRGFFEEFVPCVALTEGAKLAEAFADYNVDHAQLLTRRQGRAIGRHYLAKALDATAGDDGSDRAPHLERFLAWARKCVLQAEELEVTPELIDGISKASATGELLCAVGERVPEILRGEVQTLDIMMKDGLLTRNYEDDMSTQRGSQALAKYVAALAELNPQLRVLEIGAGTGSATLPILEALSGGVGGDGNDTIPNFEHYVFTDISSSFFESARKKLARWPELSYSKLDITRDPAEQGFEAGTYDLVIATNVLHATPDIVETIKNVRSLLKPGTGKLGLLEVMDNNNPAALPFALLPGWWLVSDDFRGGVGSDGPLMSKEMWDSLFVKHGFSGIEGAIADWPNAEESQMNAYWTTRVDEVEDDLGLGDDLEPTKPFFIYGPMSTPEDVELAEAVSEAVGQGLGVPPPQVKTLSDLDSVQDSFCIFLDSTESSFLTKISSEEEFDFLRRIILESSGLLWATPENDSPEYDRIKGFLRAIRLEDSTRKLLQVDAVPRDPEQAAAIVAKLAASLVKGKTGMVFREQEYVWRQGMLHVPRVRRLRATEETFAIESGTSVLRTQNVWEGHSPENALRLTIGTPGSLDSIYFERHNLTGPSAPLRDDEIIVKVDAAGINFRDILLMLGTIPWDLPGVEGAGVVERAGARVSHVRPGDRVYYLAERGGFSTYVRMRGVRACRLPAGVSAADAASMPAAYSTALMCLDRVARVRPGESVLVHAASGAVGQACVRVARNMGAVVFATAGSAAKREFLHGTLGIPKDHIFSSRTAEFRQGILNVTNGKGVDVVVNSLSGQLLQETWSLVAEFGRFIEIGKKDILDNAHLGMRKFYGNVSFTCVDLAEYFTKRPEFLRDCLSEIATLWQDGKIGPMLPVTKLPVSEAETGLRRLQAGSNIGKIVITFGADERVLAEAPSPLRLQEGKLLRADATYLVTGGTGGVGRSLVRWMLDNGASNVVLLGRSGTSNPAVASVVQQYNNPASGVHVRALACDAGSRDSLTAALSTLSDLPAVRGVIHGALYLRDAMFENSTLEDWKRVNAPKIDAAWYLHELLPRLDFFVALASATGVTGNIGQTFYCGTSTFLDAFCKYRTAQGLPSVSISLPVVDDVGYVIDREGMREQLIGIMGIKASIAQVHSLIHGAILGASSGLNHESRTIAYVREDSPTSEYWEARSPYLLGMREKKAAARGHEGRGGEAAEGEEGVLEALSGRVSAITMIDREDVTPERSLLEYGLDSLVAVELRNWIKRTCGVQLALTHITNSVNLQALADLIASQSA